MKCIDEMKIERCTHSLIIFHRKVPGYICVEGWMLAFLNDGDACFDVHAMFATANTVDCYTPDL